MRNGNNFTTLACMQKRVILSPVTYMHDLLTSSCNEETCHLECQEKKRYVRGYYIHSNMISECQLFEYIISCHSPSVSYLLKYRILYLQN